MKKKDPVVPARAGISRQGERIQKLLAAAGLGSRREIERWIAAGRVRVGGRVAQLGDRAGPDAAVSVDGKRISLRSSPHLRRPRVLAYHKPVGELVTRSDPKARPTAFSRLPPLAGGRWISVGRLDFNSSGLLLFTDDGELAHRLMHPRAGIEREYEVRVQGGLSAAAVAQLLSGVQLEDGPARFSKIEAIGGRKDSGTNRWYRVTLTEGRNREVRRMVEAVGGRVSRLVRVRFGSVRLPNHLAPGRCIEIDAGAVAPES